MIDTEILAAIDKLKSGKAEGCDGIPAELLKALGDRGKRCLVEVFKSIYETGLFYKSDKCYNREIDERFRMCRP